MPRLIPDDALVEITARTQGGRFLMRPTEALNRRILGILGRALHLYPVALYAFAFLSNHYHLLARARDGAALSNFLRYFNGCVAKAIQAETGWTFRVWHRRSSVIQVIDDDAAVARLRYILAHGAKEGLVVSPLEWPGLTCARALSGMEELVGRWSNQTKASRIRATGREPEPFEVERTYPIVLAPLPAWAALSVDERRAKVKEMVTDIERDARLQHPIPLGPHAVRAQDPFAAAAPPKRARMPAAHASTLANYLRFVAARRALLEAYRSTTRELERRSDNLLPAPGFLPAFFHSRGQSAIDEAARPALVIMSRRPGAPPSQTSLRRAYRARHAKPSTRALRPSPSLAAKRPSRRSAPG